MAGEREQLLGQAAALEKQALEAGEATPRGGELRRQAAELRRQALGPRTYPVLMCSNCFQLTGWLTSAGECDLCARRALVQSAYANPHGGFVDLTDARPPKPESHASFRSVLAGFGLSSDRARVAEWLKLVVPDETGPVEPEENYEVEVAHRDEVAPVEGSGALVRFSTATHRFVDGSWTRLETTKAPRSQLLVPTEFSGALPVEQLLAAWSDYQVAVHGFNADRWALTAPAREAGRQAAIAHADALREQRHVTDLLQEDA